MSTYLRLEDGSLWPDPADPDDVEWSLRYGDAPQRLLAASYLAAYRELVNLPERQRNRKVRMIRSHTAG